jgi:hypothetical protein
LIGDGIRDVAGDVIRNVTGDVTGDVIGVFEGARPGPYSQAAEKMRESQKIPR